MVQPGQIYHLTCHYDWFHIDLLPRNELEMQIWWKRLTSVGNSNKHFESLGYLSLKAYSLLEIYSVRLNLILTPRYMLKITSTCQKTCMQTTYRSSCANTQFTIYVPLKSMCMIRSNTFWPSEHCFICKVHYLAW